MAISFDSIVFGPIHSRRLGNSLGVNLLPKHGKICSFDCVYCECGWNKDGLKDTAIPSKSEVFNALEDGIKKCSEDGTPVDSITFSGNGEPTLHPDFPEIIDKVVELRAKYFPEAVISVLSNATMIGKPQVMEALSKIDNPILKIDSVDENVVRLLNKPVSKDYSVKKVIETLKLFNGKFTLQTMFLKGLVDGVTIDGTDPELVSRWYRLVAELNPRQVMIYTLDRVPPLASLEKIPLEELNEIAAPVKEMGIDVIVAG